MSALKPWLPVVGAAAACLLAQWLMSGHAFFEVQANLVGVAVILAVSLNIVNGVTGQFSIGHGGFMGVGAYLGVVTSNVLKQYELHLPPVVADQLVLLVSLAVGGSVAGALGFLVGLPSLRLKGDYLAIVTLGFGEIIRVIVQNTGEVEKGALKEASDSGALSELGYRLTHLGGSLGLHEIPQLTSAGMVWFWVFVVVLVSRRLVASPHGRSLLAIREDEIAAEAMGVDTTGYKVRSFAVASFFAGVAGALFAHFQGAINPSQFDFVKSTEVVVFIVAGGLGSTSGAVVSAMVLTLLPEAMRSAFGGLNVEQLRKPIFGLLLVVIMLTRPKGLFGTHEVWDLFGKKKRSAA